MSGLITKEMWHATINDREVQVAMDELEIFCSDRGELFDRLDADGSGTLDISEMISGLMKLRGSGTDVAIDTVATFLGVRAMQEKLGDVRGAIQDLCHKEEHMNDSLDGVSGHPDQHKMNQRFSGNQRLSGMMIQRSGGVSTPSQHLGGGYLADAELGTQSQQGPYGRRSGLGRRGQMSKMLSTDGSRSIPLMV